MTGEVAGIRTGRLPSTSQTSLGMNYCDSIQLLVARWGTGFWKVLYEGAVVRPPCEQRLPQLWPYPAPVLAPTETLRKSIHTQTSNAGHQIRSTSLCFLTTGLSG